MGERVVEGVADGVPIITVARQFRLHRSTMQATIARLEQRIRELKGGTASLRGMPGHKPGAVSGAATEPCPPCAKRSVNHARRRATPTTRSEPALAV